MRLLPKLRSIRSLCTFRLDLAYLRIFRCLCAKRYSPRASEPDSAINTVQLYVSTVLLVQSVIAAAGPKRMHHPCFRGAVILVICALRSLQDEYARICKSPPLWHRRRTNKDGSQSFSAIKSVALASGPFVHFVQKQHCCSRPSRPGPSF